jgi:vanillate/4-hydroxybenzoate decarboxylase subunit C
MSRTGDNNPHVVHDMRSFLEHLDEHGQLLRIEEEVMLEPDISAAGRGVSNLGTQSPALLFSNIKGYKNARIALNVHGSWPNHAIMLGLPLNTGPREQFDRFVELYQKFPGEVEERDDAPWQKNVIDKDINLFDILPLFRTNRGDGGFYIDKSVITSRSPRDFKNDNIENLGIYRIGVKGKNRLGIQPVPEHDIAVHLTEAEERGEDLPVYLAIGASPLTEIVAGMPILYDQSEFQMIGALQGSPCRVVRMPSGHRVPWGAEFVLEGRILSRVREMEGPFGEFTGHYSGCRAMPVLEITKVYYREDPIYEHLYLGMPWTEIDYVLALNTGAPLYVQLKEAFPEIQSVNAMYTHGLVVIISTKRRVGGFAKAVGMRCMTTPHGMGYAKIVIVVDETVNPYDLNQVLWAISTKVNPAGDVIIIPHLSVLALDPGSSPPGMTHKMIIDATTPVPPDKRGSYDQQLDNPIKTDEWQKKLVEMIDQKRAKGRK